MAEHHADEPRERLSRPAFDVVALAASAGGLKALAEILGALPADFPAAVVVVQHLDPRHQSLMAEILGRRVAMSVRQARAGDRLEPGSVFIAPPNHHLIVEGDGTLSLSQAELVHFVRPSADLLFESVAGSYGDRAIAVVLTALQRRDQALEAMAKALEIRRHLAQKDLANEQKDNAWISCFRWWRSPGRSWS